MFLPLIGQCSEEPNQCFVMRNYYSTCVLVSTFEFQKLVLKEIIETCTSLYSKLLIKAKKKSNTQPVFAGSKLTIEALAQGVKYVQS